MFSRSLKAIPLRGHADEMIVGVILLSFTERQLPALAGNAGA